MSAALRHCGALVAARTVALTGGGILSQPMRRPFALLARPALNTNHQQQQQHQQQQSRGHKNFGHKPEPMPLFTRLWQGLLGVSMLAVWIDWKR